mgnify:FL=1
MNLLDYRKSIYSSIGNDGVIEKIFDVLKIENGFFVEFGAWDGIKGSNCRNLYNKGWSGIFIEPDVTRYADLVKNYENSENITCINSFVDTNDNKFDNLVSPFIHTEIDFCSIDIDGLDLEVFETFEKFLPKVICIEGGQMLEPNYPRIPAEIAKNNIQQSLQTMVNSFEKKGYKLLCTYQDGFFVKAEYFDLFKIDANTNTMYLQGLYSIHRRLPWIQHMLRLSGLRNKVVDYILQRAEYSHYGYKNRKAWAAEKEEETKKIITHLLGVARVKRP